jgi:hypothetical protein
MQGLWLIERRESRWQSPLAAMLVTATLFTAALASMTRTGADFAPSPVAEAAPRIVFFEPPPRVESKPRPVEPPRTIVPPKAAPTKAQEHPMIAPAPVVVPAAPPIEVPARDSSSSGRTAAETKALLTQPVPARDVPTFSGSKTRPIEARGAPMAPSGVTMHSTPLTTAQRDSIANSAVANALSADRDEFGRRGRIGNASGSKPGVLSAGVSIPFPLFSPGPSAAGRKRNAIIDADNQLRLRRLQDRALAQADSTRTDSLRRDSLARRSIRP